MLRKALRALDGSINLDHRARIEVLPPTAEAIEGLLSAVAAQQALLAEAGLTAEDQWDDVLIKGQSLVHALRELSKA